MSQPDERAASARRAASSGGALERLAIAGSGTIARGLAACAAACPQAVASVQLWARSQDSAERARAAIELLHDKLPAPSRHEVTVTTRLADLSEATLVVEAVAERDDVKRAMHERVAAVLEDGDALLATTTSSLDISALAEASGRSDRFFGLHVFNPVTRMELVEVCFPSAAGRDVRERARAFCEAIGKTAIEVPDEPGFVVNRLLFPFLFDAVRLLERTGMQPAEVDACMKLGASHPMGPLELLDLVGIDVAEAIGEALFGDTGDPSHRPPGRIKELVGKGRLGRKSGAGFYRY